MAKNKCSGIISAYGSNDSTKLWNKSIKKSNTVKNSVGTFITINDNLFVLTCYHCVQKSYKIIMYYFLEDGTDERLKSIELCIEIYSDEMDIVLLKPIDEIKNYKSVYINEFDQRLPKKKDKIMLHCIDIKNIINENMFVQKKQNHCCVNDIIFEECESINTPLLPYVYLTIDDNTFYKQCNVEGLSGTLLTNNNGTISGMLINMTTSNMNMCMVPSVVLHRFFNEYLSTKRFVGLCDIVGKFIPCEIINKYDNEHKPTYGLLINKTYDINYNKILCSETDFFGFNPKINDVIIGINGLTFGEKYTIFDKKYNEYFPFSTYIALNYKCDDIIELNILRSNKEKIKNKKIKVKSRPIWTMKYIKIKSNTKFCNLNGLIFIEMNEEFIEICRNNEIILDNSIMKYLINEPYRDNNKTIVILVDIIRDDIVEDDIQLYNSLGLPFIRSKENCYEIKADNTKYRMAIAKKINGKNITNLSVLCEEHGKINKTEILKLEIGNSKNIGITFKNNRIKKYNIV
jgi:hypothetical protein